MRKTKALESIKDETVSSQKSCLTYGPHAGYALRIYKGQLTLVRNDHVRKPSPLIVVKAEPPEI